MRIDAHQHFWKYNEVRDAWITDDMEVIRKNFLPEDLRPVLQAHAMDGSIVIQSDQSKEENVFQLANALQHDFIKGVVGWIDLRAKDILHQLEYYQEFKKLKGFRHVLQGEKQRDLMLHPDFKNGIRQLKSFGYTYDILIYPDQLKYAVEFVKAFPDQPFVLDHIAKPNIKKKDINEWRNDIQALASFENVFCKVSGMVTEASWNDWRKEDFAPYLDVVAAAFTPSRLMYGSDWPVCLVAASYADVFKITEDYFSSFSPSEQELIFGDTAAKFYNILT